VNPAPNTVCKQALVKKLAGDFDNGLGAVLIGEHSELFAKVGDGMRD